MIVDYGLGVQRKCYIRLNEGLLETVSFLNTYVAARCLILAIL